MHVVGEYPVVCHVPVPAAQYSGGPLPGMSLTSLVCMLVLSVNNLYLMFLYIGVELYY